MPNQFSFSPVDHDPFAEAIDYADKLPEGQSSGDLSHLTGGPAVPFDPYEYAKDPNNPTLKRLGYALPLALGEEIGHAAQGAWNAVTLPGDVLTGKVDPNSQEAIERSANLAGMMTLPAAAPELPAANTLGIFAGARSKTSNKLDLLNAAEKTDLGEHPNKILEDTGWHQGVDKGWRYEISDENAKLHPSVETAISHPTHSPDITYAGRLGDLLQHPDLFKAYPEMKDYRVRIGYNPGGKYSGEFDPNTKEITAIGNVLKADEKTNLKTHSDPLDVLLHEVQHGVQDIENFDPGANTDHLQQLLQKVDPTVSDLQARRDAYNLYRSNAGEVEARNVTQRRWDDDETRRKMHPFDTMDIPPEDQMLMPRGTISLSAVEHDPFAGE